MKNRTAIFISTVLVLSFILCFSAIKLVKMIREYSDARSRYEELSNDYIKDSPSADQDNGNYESEPSDDSPANENVSPIDVDFAALLSISSDIEAWLYCPDTIINYPVVHCDNNDKYLYGYINGDYSISGSLFVDYRCLDLFAGPLTVIYGHNMKDGSMLASICNYKNQDYYDAHPIMYLNTTEGNYIIKIFSAFTTSTDSDIYNFTLENDSVFLSYLNKTKSMSDFTCNVVPEINDRIVMLSTCTYDYDNARYVLLGLLDSIS